MGVRIQIVALVGASCLQCSQAAPIQWGCEVKMAPIVREREVERCGSEKPFSCYLNVEKRCQGESNRSVHSSTVRFRGCRRFRNECQPEALKLEFELQVMHPKEEAKHLAYLAQGWTCETIALSHRSQPSKKCPNSAPLRCFESGIIQCIVPDSGRQLTENYQRATGICVSSPLGCS